MPIQKNKLLKSFFINDDNAAIYAIKIAAWINEKVKQAHRNGVALGMSGGIDCSVVARLCQIGRVDVQLVLMPYGDDMKNTRSADHAMQLINKFNFSYHIFDIKPAVDALRITPDLTNKDDAKSCTLSGNFASFESIELSHANICPRVRMTYLYQIAQIGGLFVIGTGNLAERTIGYFTKWGDGACDLNPLAMLTKQEVYTLARYLEIPDCILNKKPSAGLWDGQTDENELGITYPQIDAYLLNGTSGNPETDQKIEKRIAMTAHKHNPIAIFIQQPDK